MELKIIGTPLDFAKNAKPAELKKIIKAIKKGEPDEYADRCRICFEHFLAGEMDQARWWSHHADLVK